MRIKIEIKKQKAIEMMKSLDIFEPYIQAFEQEDKVCVFEGYAGFWVDQRPALAKAIKEFEKEHNATVFAVTHEILEFGDCYDFLFIPDYKSDWDELLYKDSNTFYIYAYVWNKTADFCSEFGTIGLRSFGGGIMRTM